MWHFGHSALKSQPILQYSFFLEKGIFSRSIFFSVIYDHLPPSVATVPFFNFHVNNPKMTVKLEEINSRWKKEWLLLRVLMIFYLICKCIISFFCACCLIWKVQLNTGFLRFYVQRKCWCNPEGQTIKYYEIFCT